MSLLETSSSSCFQNLAHSLVTGSELKIAAGHRPFPVQFSTKAAQKFDHNCMKSYRWPIKISAWPAKPKALFLAPMAASQQLWGHVWVVMHHTSASLLAHITCTCIAARMSCLHLAVWLGYLQNH